jgi:hypothetical protein
LSSGISSPRMGAGSTCDWVRRKLGAKLNLENAAQLRHFSHSPSIISSAQIRLTVGEKVEEFAVDLHRKVQESGNTLKSKCGGLEGHVQGRCPEVENRVQHRLQEVEVQVRGRMQEVESWVQGGSPKRKASSEGGSTRLTPMFESHLDMRLWSRMEQRFQRVEVVLLYDALNWAQMKTLRPQPLSPKCPAGGLWC